jgi:hypothetical protein
MSFRKTAMIVGLAGLLAISAIGVVYATQTQQHHKSASPIWNGWTWQHFDQNTLWGCDTYCGTYVGQTSTWADNNVQQIGSENNGYELCNGSLQEDWDTGWLYVYGGHQSWVQGSGGFSTSWTCYLLGFPHLLMLDFAGNLYQGVPFVNWTNQSFQGGDIETLLAP